MEENNKISKKIFELVEDYSNESLDHIFIENESSNIQNITESLLSKTMTNKTIQLIEETTSNDRVYIISPKLNPNQIKKTLNDAIKRGVIIYMLTSFPNLLKDYFGRILVRESISIPDATLVLRESNDDLKGILSGGSLEEVRDRYILEVDHLQALDLKRYFVNVFWNRSECEFLEGEEREPVSLYNEFLYDNLIESRDRIIDVFDDFLLNNTSVHCHYNKNFKYSQLEKGSLYINSRDISTLEFVKKLGSTNSIFFNDSYIQDTLFFNDDEGFYISNLPLSEESFIIRLNSQQLHQLNSYYTSLSEERRYRYSPTSMVKEIENRFFYIDNPSKNYSVKDSIDRRLNSISCEDIEEFINYDLEAYTRDRMKFNPKDPAIKYRYFSEVHPPLLPKNLKKSKLIREWEVAAKKFKDIVFEEIKRLEDDIKNIEFREGILFKLFKIPKIKKWKSDIEKLEKLKKLDFISLSPIERDKKLSLLSKIKEENFHNKKEINLKEDEEKWTKNRNSLKDRLKKKTSEVDDIKKKVSKLDKELPQKIHCEVGLLKKELLHRFKSEIDSYIGEIENFEIIEEKIKEIKKTENKKLVKLKDRIEEKNSDNLKRGNAQEKVADLTIDEDLINLLNNLSERDKMEIFNRLKLKRKKRMFTSNLKLEEISEAIFLIKIKLEKLVENKTKEVKNLKNLNQLREIDSLCGDKTLRGLYNKHSNNIKSFKAKTEEENEKLLGLEEENEKVIKEIDKLGKNFSKKIERSNKTISLQISIPDEEINEVGELFEEAGRRYLAIENYSELEVARREAIRLDAKICVH